MSASSDGRIAELIAQQAGIHGARVLSHQGRALLVLVQLRRSSGKVTPYHLHVEVTRGDVLVREHTPERLPAFCPDRHINPGGGFCLGYSETDPQRIEDDEGVVLWWRKVLKFLALQETAARLGRWPTTVEWAHGSAAVHQARAERCAEALGHHFVEALGRRRLQVRRRGNAPAFVTLREGERRLYSVWVKPGRVATLRQRCVCGSGKALNACADHAAMAAGLVQALMDWNEAEKRFWKAMRQQTCCGSMPDCPMNKTVAPPPPAALAA
ncbi:E2 domain-associated cysteine-rich protein [uncultured Caulobacter sp.]|uniref:E2 domain-associated cysteine-rich protein n=1 Tax=uncultured Caulobacter sp. TaxID=158749 RepID=UPI0026332BCC|nr:E2 domain-associated cysteine-rich protein [uncultured Caulobacter sp.]